MSALSKLMEGWNYHFTPRAPVNAQHTARRSTFDQFQTMPGNRVEGAGTLTAPGGVPGKYWSVVQPPQVFANHVGVTESLIAGGVRAVGLYNSALADNPNASNGF